MPNPANNIPSNNIQEQVSLPLSVVLEIVLQGLRIRLGRSLVTIAGVTLGITFLMSMLTGQLINTGMHKELAARSETRRMLNFLETETGPLNSRPLAILAVGPANPAELRLITALRAQGANPIRWHGPNPPADVTASPLPSLADGAVALLLVGDGPFTPDQITPLLASARQRVVARTRILETPLAIDNASVTSLAVEVRPEERAEELAAAQRENARSLWIIIISLLVTAIGISNAMLLSVTERFREIGTMKCLGALSAFIRKLFLIESLIVGAIGTLLGVILGILVPILFAAPQFGFANAFTAINWPWLALYAALSFAAGLALSTLAAVYPARFASRMVPAAALRSTI